MELNIDDLENVAGGTSGRNCWFEPENPTNLEGGWPHVRVKCKSRCTAQCGCHGTTHCVNRFHLVEQTSGNHITYPFPMSENNHSDPRKKVELPAGMY